MTLTEAHFACTAAIRNAKEWVSAVSKPGGNQDDPEYLGQAWALGGNVSAGSFSYPRQHNDPFSVPATDPNFTQTRVSELQCPFGRFSGVSGLDFLGFKPNVNLSTVDYNDFKNVRQANWPALASKVPVNVGNFQVHTWIIPSSITMDILRNQSSSSLKTYMVVCIAYRNGLPVLRSRCLLQEQSSARYAYRSNVGGRDIMGNPVTWNVVNANSVLFDGPVHTNDAPYVSVPSSYWNAALQYFANDPLMKRPKRAFMGPLTFSGTSTLLNPGLAFDGVGYQGGNYGGTSIDNRPFDNAGNPIPSTAQGANPNPDSGPIVNRYDRLIEGGRQALSKISSVPLPDNLISLKYGAFGDQAETGLDPNAAQVSSVQRDGSLPTPTVTIPQYRNSSGNLVNAQTFNNNNSADNGIFVNTVQNSTEVAGGVVIKGDARTMYLEVTDADGKVVNSSQLTSLEDGSAIGNPTIRIQNSTTSYDSNSGTDIYNHVNVPTYTPPQWVPTGSPTWVPTVPGTAGYTVATVAGYTQAGTAGYTQAGASPLHSPVTSCPSPNYTPPAGGGAGQGTYSCPHVGNPTWIPGTPATWVATVAAYYVPGSGTIAGYTQAGTPGYTQAGFTTNNWVPTGPPIGKNPHQYRAQDWVVDVKNVATKIPGTIPLPNNNSDDHNAWRFGVGTRITTTSNNTKTANRLGEGSEPVAANSGITQVVVHQGASDVTGTPLAPNASQDVPVGKVLVYKQSRSDANRVDVFVLDAPPPPPSWQPGDPRPPGLNGAVYGTGNIHALRGVNMERKTIGVEYGTSDATERGINIIDNVWQFGTPRGLKPTNANHGLGLAAPKMNVQTREASFQHNKLLIYATIIAGSANQNYLGTGPAPPNPNPYKGLDVSNANNSNTTDFNRKANTTDTNAHQRTLEIFGGLTEQQTRARLDGSRGWGQQMNFDEQLSQFPPPFFPSSNVLQPLAYHQESVIGK